MQAENDLILAEIEPLEDDKALLTELKSVTVLGVSLALGLIGDVLFFHYRPGINVPIYTVIFLLAGAALLVTFQKEISQKNAVFGIPVLIFATLLSVFTAPELVLLNGAAAVGTLFLLVRYVTTRQFIGGHWLSAVMSAVQFGFIGWAEGPLVVLANSAQWFGRVKISQEHAARFGAVVRGLLLTVPIVVLFGLLLASADAIFGDLLTESMSWLVPDNMDSLIMQGVVVGFFTWVGVMLFKVLLLGQHENPFQEVLLEKRKVMGFRLTMIETSMVLGSVDVLFLVFVLIQAKYLFGGEANITVQGYTYSEYARRGFFELLAVSAMTMALVVALDFYTFRLPTQERLFQGLTFGMVALTVVMLVAAFTRLNLYEDVYGFTRLRVMTQVFMVWLAVLFAVLVADLLYRNKKIFWTGCLVTAVGFVLTLNLMNMDGFIASRNIARFEETGKLDVLYLTTLSDDAIPTVAQLLEKEDALGEQKYQALLAGLGPRLYFLDQDRQERGWLGYHFSKDRAWKALDRYREILAPFIRPTYSRYAF